MFKRIVVFSIVGLMIFAMSMVVFAGDFEQGAFEPLTCECCVDAPARADIAEIFATYQGFQMGTIETDGSVTPLGTDEFSSMTMTFHAPNIPIFFLYAPDGTLLNCINDFKGTMSITISGDARTPCSIFLEFFFPYDRGPTMSFQMTCPICADGIARGTLRRQGSGGVNGFLYAGILFHI